MRLKLYRVGAGLRRSVDIGVRGAERAVMRLGHFGNQEAGRARPDAAAFDGDRGTHEALPAEILPRSGSGIGTASPCSMR